MAEMEVGVAVVTGAAGAMAQSIISRLRAAGYDTVGVDRRAADLSAHADSQESWVVSDLESQVGCRDVLDQIKSQSHRIDILVNCAGSFRSDAEIMERPEELLRLFSDNLASAAWMCLLSLPLLQNGRDPLVVNIASTDGVVASAGQSTEVGVSHDTLYAASKGGVIAFTRALAMAWAPYGIRVNGICPTITRTRMTADLLAIPGKEAALSSSIPLGRICDPEDIAAAVCSLIPLRMTTGHLLTVDGGYLCL